MADQKVYGPLTLPAGTVVYFRRPTGKDRSEVMTAIDFNDEQFMKGSIQVEQAIRAKCLVKVNGNAPEVNYLRAFDEWDDAEVQFYGEVFSRMFGMNEEKREEAKKAADFLLANSTSIDGFNSTEESATTAG
jgi:hypothetical protein